ncbi:hypothetical protein LHFGNBLO_000874 [Mesorhizobium sp. AR10]|uniref:hypothetical protein n=1 Tax=Mesorhizobium sp. AR10 TaxID=2865839 RepID=UPI002160E88E|nr:hypothetical protein [Mesorhizobium sp. AR10]UVK41778.1 hypothetical protein LHFGNBLO_000874 [Mesorhizobium sp. AR10]
MAGKKFLTLFSLSHAVYPVESRFQAKAWHESGFSWARVPFRERHALDRSQIERRVMSFFKKISRRAIVQALIALPALSLFRSLPDADPSHADPDEIVEVNGWILKRSDLA